MLGSAPWEVVGVGLLEFGEIPPCIHLTLPPLSSPSHADNNFERNLFRF